MKKIVLSGSASLQKEINELRDKLQNEYQILDYPKPLSKDEFTQAYPQVLKDFLQSIALTDVLLIVNADKNGVRGYVGAQSFAELCFGLSQKLVYGRNIDLYIFQMPEKSVQCYDEIKLWLDFGWISIWNEQD